MKEQMKEQLIADINAASSEKELISAISEIPKQANGEKTSLYQMLNHAFWYDDLKGVEQKRAYMLRIINECPHLFYVFY